MSEAGKVSLPTPERIQELKGRYEGLSPEDITFMTVGELTGLLAALEETQQQLHDHGPNGRNYTNQQYVGLGYQLTEEKAFREETDKELRQAESENVKLVNELAEAQQTIARQREALTRINDLHVRGIEDKVCEPFRKIAKATLEGSNQA